ncbi:MAG: branched-chain amino acid ABC transporter permease [Rhodobacteraceae bacterium]|nr:branched-chain amino acid ABC transporter permease [Paracoccaceae bacterium]
MEKSPVLVAAVTLTGLIVLGFALPDWAQFLMTIALAKGLVSLGIVAGMRCGVVSFGQGLYFCLGAYTAGLMSRWTGVTDVFLLTFLSVIVAGGVGVIFGPLLSRYRGIFFAMLSLSLSMILFGALAKTTSLGGTDGVNVAAPTFAGYAPEGGALATALYLFIVTVTVIIGTVMRIVFDSQSGLVSLAVRSNELRVEYLGSSANGIVAVSYVIAAILGGVGGVVTALAIGHVDPEYAFWTTSGEFVFVAILAGYLSIPAVFVASIVLEVVRSFSNLYFPNTWQLVLGVFLLVVILVRPDGIGSIKLWRRRESAGAAEPSA